MADLPPEGPRIPYLAEELPKGLNQGAAAVIVVLWHEEEIPDGGHSRQHLPGTRRKQGCVKGVLVARIQDTGRLRNQARARV